MSKSADAFRTISEVAEWLDTPAHVLRFWESKFTQVKPVKRAGGRRYYRPADMRLLGGIKKLLHEDGMTIKGAQKVLREHGIKHVSSLCTLSLGDEDDDFDQIEMHTDVEAEPADTVIPFSKPEADPAPVTQDDASQADLLNDAPVENAAPQADTVAEPAVLETAAAPPEPIEVPAEDVIAPATTEVADTVDDAALPAAGELTDAVEEAATMAALAENEPELSGADDTDQASGPVPSFLQHSMSERGSLDDAESDATEVTESPAAPAEPAEPLPGALSHLSRITRLSPDMARQIAPVLERLRAAAR